MALPQTNSGDHGSFSHLLCQFEIEVNKKDLFAFNVDVKIITYLLN